MQEKLIRSPRHLKYVRTLPCMITRTGENCNGTPVVAHHLTFIKEGGMGQKVGDNWTVPLSHAHHQELHRIGEKTFWAKCGFTLEELETYAKELWGINDA
jgi:hypothetical protein